MAEHWIARGNIERVASALESGASPNAMTLFVDIHSLDFGEREFEYDYEGEQPDFEQEQPWL